MQTSSKIARFISEQRKHRWLANYLWVATIEGFLISLFLISLPSDPENRVFLHLTRPRLFVLLVMLLLTSLTLYLAIKSQKDIAWSQKWSSKIIDDQRVVPYISIILVVLLSLLGISVILYRTEDFIKLNPAVLTRLAPPFIWLGLLWVQLWITWIWVWKRHEIRLPAWTWDALAAGLLFLAALWPRIQMTAYGLPYQSVWDEVITYTPALNMLTTPGMKPGALVPGYGYASYGDLITYVATGGELLGLFNGLRAGTVYSVQEYVAPPQGVRSTLSAVHVSGLPIQAPRLIFAFLNSLAPVGIYLALRRGLRAGQAASLAGGFIYALLSRDVLYYSSYILPDALTATLVIFLMICAWKSLGEESSRVWNFLLTGLLAGLMVSATIRVAPVILVPILAVFLSRNKQQIIAKLVVSIAGIAAGFFLFSPYALLDLPSYLARATGLTWGFDLSLANRLSGLAYYLKGLFMPGFNSIYVDSNEGSVGVGLVVGFLAIIGLGNLLLRKPRHVILILYIFVLHLYVISPIVQRYTRHALLLYPLVCILAGVGLGWIVEGLQSLLHFVSSKMGRKVNAAAITYGAPAFILLAFLLVSARSLNMTLRYVSRMHNYQAPQEKAAEFLSKHMAPGDKVGILQELPWIEDDLQARGIVYERVAASDTSADLKAKQITIVAGTDRFGGDYTSLSNTIWGTGFKQPGVKLGEFGVGSLLYDGYPAGQLYIFVARLP